MTEYTADRLFDTTYYSLRINKDHFRPRVISPFGANRGECSLVDIVRDKGYPLAINAGLFYPMKGEPITYKPEGIIIEGGAVLHNAAPVLYSDSMPLTIDSNGDLWFAPANADAYDLVNRGVVYAVCGFMPIIINGETVPQEQWTNVPHYTVPHMRQIIGQYRNGDYSVITCEGKGNADSIGWTIADAQEVCKRHGLWFAYNLDGGTSNETVVDGVQINSFCQRDEGRFAPTFIVFENIFN